MTKREKLRILGDMLSNITLWDSLCWSVCDATGRIGKSGISLDYAHATLLKLGIKRPRTSNGPFWFGVGPTPRIRLIKRAIKKLQAK